MPLNRRAFLRAAASSAAAFGGARLAIGSVTAAPAPDTLVRLLVESDRAGLIERLAVAIRGGLPYPQLLGALAEAAAREVRPYPQVGFKYHAFMVLHAVHRATLLGRAEDRWLPVLWATNIFKSAQADQRRLGGSPLAPLPAGSVPDADRAELALVQALERWHIGAADTAVVDLLRSAPRERLFAPLFRFGARDFRAIGHKAITVANCHRLLRVVPPDHAEPMLRSLVLALQNHLGEPNPADADLAPDRPWRRNLALAGPLPGAAPSGVQPGAGQVVGMLEVLREGSDEDASQAMRAGLDRGIADPDLWTVVFLAAGELLLKQSGIVSVHANTTADALHYAWRHSDSPETRRLLLLQAAAFMPLFRDLLGGELRPLRIDTLTAPEPGGSLVGSPEDIFATLGSDPLLAARQTLGYLSSGGTEAPFVTLARRYTVERTSGYHDYKLAEAAFANATAMASPWRERYLAASVFYLNGPSDPPNAIVAQARALLA
jgi:hypothetical protein